MRNRNLILLVGLLLVYILSTIACGSSGKANIRLVNASPDESGLDLLVDGTSLATSVGFASTSGYKSISSGSRHLKVEASGSSTKLIDTTANVSSAAYLSLIILNYSYAISDVILTDDNSTPASGDFRIRIVNAAPGLGAQDVYVEPAGTNISTVSPTFSNLAFGSASTYTSLAAGDYEIFFTGPGQKFANIDTAAISFSSGQVRTVLSLNGQQSFTWAELSDLN